ncbi:pantoate--beta-alanine ligase [Mucisphaera sp.]|uniref:pantoate--beta-alanine ligase n=1 Tax=Mucisphaera sp. TaxID=2913024 RepID=UPI003D139BDD
MSRPEVIDTVSALRHRRQELKGRLAFVPTMGALHDGHVSLMKRAAELGAEVWVSVFVNPTQFGPGEDLERYPRDLDADLERCADAGVTVVFAPGVEQMYPPASPAVAIDVPDLTGVLEGASRPTHFAGVCRVVAKLLNQVQPDVACFGQKDYQQLAVVRAMVTDLAMPVGIEAVPTVREADGLAMSSRNRFLSKDERHRAVALWRSLETARAMVDQGQVAVEVIETRMRAIIEEAGLTVDYAVLRDAVTLAQVEKLDRDCVALVAARIGSVRLIDNTLLG